MMSLATIEQCEDLHLEYPGTVCEACQEEIDPHGNTESMILSQEKGSAAVTTTDIAMLFARDPLKLTRADIDAIIAALRDKRRTFGQPTAKPAATRKTRVTKADKLTEGMDIEVEL